MDDRSQVAPDSIDTLRATVARRRRWLSAIRLLAILLIPACLWFSWTPPLRLVWNASASEALGLYLVEPGRRADRGELVVAWPPPPARALAAERGYLPLSTPLLKRVAAVGGDEVCAGANWIRINGRLAAIRQRSDPTGRAMPQWSGCMHLAAGDRLLMGNGPYSFDGRYFGISRGAEIIGRGTLLWAF